MVGGFYRKSIIVVSESNICILRFGLGVKGGLLVDGAPKMHNILGLSQVEHLHLDRYHVHGSSHEGMVLSSVQSLVDVDQIHSNRLWGGLVVCSLVCVLFCCVNLSLDYLCVH